MEEQQVLSAFKESGALLEGHFRLTSGLHSNQYFQCAKVLQYPELAEALCREIVKTFRPHSVEVVIAPALGGVVVGQEVGRQLRSRSIFTERTDGVMQLRRGFEIRRGERVLVCEDVVTTGGSVLEVIEIVKSLEGRLVGVGSIVDRTGRTVKFPLDQPGVQYAVFSLDVVAYPPNTCPLCQQGLPLVKPGSR